MRKIKQSRSHNASSLNTYNNVSTQGTIENQPMVERRPKNLNILVQGETRPHHHSFILPEQLKIVSSYGANQSMQDMQAEGMVQSEALNHKHKVLANNYNRNFRKE